MWLTNKIFLYYLFKKIFWFSTTISQISKKKISKIECSVLMYWVKTRLCFVVLDTKKSFLFVVKMFSVLIFLFIIILKWFLFKNEYDQFFSSYNSILNNHVFGFLCDEFEKMNVNVIVVISMRMFIIICWNFTFCYYCFIIWMCTVCK